MKHRIQRIDLQGFRGFGASPQSFTLPASVVALWGGNSQGKTSLAEAIEFLLTGHIARRELLASAKDEFSRALRNAHIPDTVAVFVEAHLVCPDGVCRRLRRTLTADYDGSTSCVSTLEIDGASCTESDIETRLGLRLLLPPLRAPILAQHTLGYVFTASPTDRAAYFRAVLDTQDLEDFRAAVAMLPAEVSAPSSAEINNLSALENIAGLTAGLKTIRNAKTKPATERALAGALQAILTAIGVSAKASLSECIDQLESELSARRAQAFPIDLFGRKPLAPWTNPTANIPDALTAFHREKAATSSETQRLVALFESALSIPAIHTCSEPMDCPLCGAASALTPERVNFLREQVNANEAYQAAEKAALAALRATDAALSASSTAALAALPRFMTITAAERRRRGFTVKRVEALSNDAEGTPRWAAASRAFWRTAKRYSDRIAALRITIEVAVKNIATWDDGAELLRGLEEAANHFLQLETAAAAYTAAIDAISGGVKSAVDQSSHTSGWEELIALARDPTGTLQALDALRQHHQTVKALERALREIDAASGKVADEKFTDLSADVLAWWERLRPGEPTFFSGVQRRGAKTRRTVDVKVALSAKEDRSDVKLRDAVAVFSQSQLHCLGLSLFLARAIDGGAGFVVLDDPVLTSDDDFRPNFASSVIEALLDAGLQVIVITQDHKSWKDIGHRWEHRGATQFQIVRENPVAGSEIRDQGDALATMLAQARTFINSQDSDQRKEGATRLRRIIERFCKELIVKSRHANGDAMASITDYDGKAYGDFSAQALALLTQDPSHKGKLNAAYGYVTPGPHDDTPPSTAQLKVAAGDLNRLKKDYLQ
ncbi:MULTISPECIES: ATP-binding protein [Bradyrhizobium]|mgnify:CR=1 FL=1|jgi:hypothetical protein|uniref:AAA family ATPase n=2 Tax=Pseudomonadota TaxID=1224 RepID=UPI000467D4BA|nr:MULTISPECIES: ATP-binding protein [Bradyrhizobium]KIU52344.1 hypothetical protein QU41_03020 [Bradyrhizobium elkanii]MBK5652758.1 AAA family ATPase [Rhizobium sp.]OCX32888.1 hypothetical protein QU42_01565 [Bradyrhizobium sp. UASWS1016]